MCPYDAAGNLLGDGAHTYAWDAEDRLVGVDGGAVRYRYDARGERAETVAAGVVTDRVAGPGANARLLNGSGQLEREEIGAAGERVATYTTAAQPGGSDNTIVSYADARGTVHLQLPVAAAPAITCSNLPFGDNLSCTGNSYQLPSPLHFTGQPRDAETGIDFFGARLYSSSLGRWMTPDWSAQAEPVPYAKLDNPQSLNLYAYVLNNPVTSVDPDGHCCLVWLDPVWAGVASGAETGAEIGAAGGTAVEPGGGTMMGGLAGATVGAAVGFGVGIYWAANNEKANSGTKPPLVGNNPRETKNRTNTDLPGGHDEAKQKFDELTKGQGRKVEPGTGHIVADDQTRLRLNPDGTARIDLPKNGVPKPETIHFNPKSSAACSGTKIKPC